MFLFDIENQNKIIDIKFKSTLNQNLSPRKGASDGSYTLDVPKFCRFVLNSYKIIVHKAQFTQIWVANGT